MGVVVPDQGLIIRIRVCRFHPLNGFMLDNCCIFPFVNNIIFCLIIL